VCHLRGSALLSSDSHVASLRDCDGRENKIRYEETRDKEEDDKEKETEETGGQESCEEEDCREEGHQAEKTGVVDTT